MPRIVVISGSPSQSAKTSIVAEYMRDLMYGNRWRTKVIKVRDLPPEALMYTQFDNPAIVSSVENLEQADGVVITTPVYKASYTGILKAFLDVLPQKILSGKVVWPIAVGGTLAHLLMLDYALTPVLFALGAQNVLSGLFLQDTWIRKNSDGGIFLKADVEKRVQEGFKHFYEALTLKE